ncbi:MAG: TlyA family RNA methyltransferase [Pseudomonadota bacterium]|jgi:23S rRNA (cytidine1920-2'-O)/16S rRNA (cytidine1409-2'-O)-methyltransferase|nr:TlyA family RNA methyltransferase [Pseudomonadota bacterium]
MQRLDLLLVERGLAATRSRAQRLVKEGRVEARLGPWRRLDKPAFKLPADTPLRVESSAADRFVSRGALKLQHALASLELDLAGITALDVGQSTGGFTDCLLQRGVARVVGIEVGHGQLHPRLRQNPRVVCLEGYNARALDRSLRDYTPDAQGFELAVMDVSFISQTLILPALAPLLRPGGWLITLVKPQFEAGPAHVGKGGVVRNPAVYERVEQTITACCNDNDLAPCGWSESPITGGDGNREFLLAARRQA